MVSPAIFRRSLKLFPIRGSSGQAKTATHQATLGGVTSGLTIESEDAVSAVDQNFLAVPDITCKQLPCQRSFNLTLDGAFERTRTVTRVVTCAHEVSSRRIS